MESVIVAAHRFGTNPPEVRRAANSKAGSWLSLLFILGAVGLEVNYNFEVVRLGNLVMMAACAAVILTSFFTGISIAKPRLQSFNVVYSIYLLWVFLSSSWSPSPVNTLVSATYLTAI